MLEISKIIKKHVDRGLEIAIVIVFGNFLRARSNTMMDSCTSDYIRMLATTMNTLAINDALKQVGVDSRVQTSVEIRQIVEFYIRDRVLKNLEKKRVIVFRCGTGSPYFSTDTVASLKALELGADIILKATDVDYVYTKESRKYSDFKAIKETSHLRVIKNKLIVMDLTAISLCMDNSIRIFNIGNLDNLDKVLSGENIGAIIK